MKTIIVLSAIAIIAAAFLVISHLNTALPGSGNKYIIDNPIRLCADPYSTEKITKRETWPDSVCGIRLNKLTRRYVLKTFPDAIIARTVGFKVTHYGNCGTCSTLQDLEVYRKKTDLTGDVRKCSLLLIQKALAVNCLKNIGFSDYCAETWYYNMVNTGRKCFFVCMISWLKRENYNNPDGSLNTCLRCDEEESGPVFKYYAGRTRRNSGIESEIRRPKDQIHQIIHDYK